MYGGLTSLLTICCCVFFFKQKTAYEMRISDWSSDVCSSDLRRDAEAARRDAGLYPAAQAVRYPDREIPGPPAPHGRHVHGGGAGTLDDDHGHAEARPADRKSVV